MNKTHFKIVFRIDIELMTLQHKLIVYTIDIKKKRLKKILRFPHYIIGLLRMGPRLYFKHWMYKDMQRWKQDPSVVMDVRKRPDLERSYKAVLDLMKDMKDRDEYMKRFKL